MQYFMLLELILSTNTRSLHEVVLLAVEVGIFVVRKLLGNSWLGLLLGLLGRLGSWGSLLGSLLLGVMRVSLMVGVGVRHNSVRSLMSRGFVVRLLMVCLNVGRLAVFNIVMLALLTNWLEVEVTVSVVTLERLVIEFVVLTGVVVSVDHWGLVGASVTFVS